MNKKTDICLREIGIQRFMTQIVGATLYTYIANVDWNFRQEHMIMRNF